jgi:hypothetical protein
MAEGAGEGPTREQKLAEIKARAEALRAAKAAGQAPAAGKVAAGAAPQAAALEVPVSSLNPGGRPGTPPQKTAIEAYGSINQSVEIKADAAENENLKKLLGGLGAYQNTVRGGAWQVDYRYYSEARRRLEAAGYVVTERDFLGRPVTSWTPASRGWTRVES